MILLGGTQCWAADYTVPGSFATIQAALNVAAAGDTITVQAGTYFEKISFPRSGDAVSGSITLQAAPGPRPILDGTGVPGSNMVLIDTQSYVQLIGFEIRNNRNVNDGSGVRVLGAGSHVAIRNNLIHDMRGRHAMGITVYGTSTASISDLVIDGNQIYDCEPATSEALTLNGNVENFAVTNNIVRDVNNIGIDFIGGETSINPDSTKVARNGVCRGNQVYRARSSYGGGFAAGIYVDGGKNITVENNIVAESDVGIEIGAENAGIVASGVIVRNNRVFNNDKAGIGFGGYQTSVGRVKNCQFLNNTCYKNDTLSQGFGELWIQYAEDNVVRNNIFYSTAQNILLASDAGNVNTVLDDNLWFTDAGAGSAQFTWNATAYGSFAAYRAGTGQDANSLFTDPTLVDPTGGDLHLVLASPAINAGDPAFTPGSGEVDIDGQPRVLDGRVDIGADEVNLNCGNGSLDPGEQCDDGNLVSGDGCDANCTTTACGNGIVTAGEACDDGNGSDNDACKTNCTLNVCGDGALNVGVEACDDGNLVSGDGCEPDCTLSPRHDSMVLPVRPLTVTIPFGQTSVTKTLRVKVRNADLEPGDTHMVRLVADRGDCPVGSIAVQPDFDTATDGVQDTIPLSRGRTKPASVILEIAGDAFPTINGNAPGRCWMTLNANTVLAGNIDPVPSNDAVAVELNVIRGGAGATTPHESLIKSVRPINVRLAVGATPKQVKVRPVLSNADLGEGGDLVTFSVPPGDCPAGMVSSVDFDAQTPGEQSFATVPGPGSRIGTLLLSIDPGSFKTGNAKSPARCTALLTAIGPGGGDDPTNNTTRLVIDVVDRNDY